MPPRELKTIGRLRPFKVASRSRKRCSTCGPSNIPAAAIHSLHPGPQALRSPLATKKIIGSGFGCAGAPGEPKVKAIAAAVPANTKRMVHMAILPAPVPPPDCMLLALKLQGPDHRH